MLLLHELYKPASSQRLPQTLLLGHHHHPFLVNMNTAVRVDTTFPNIMFLILLRSSLSYYHLYSIFVDELNPSHAEAMRELFPEPGNGGRSRRRGNSRA